ncbi:MAG: SurA N-terminal domain-containing protein [Minisyncoccota bacterium]
MENKTTTVETKTDEVETTEKIDAQGKKYKKEEIVRQARTLLASKKTLALLIILFLAGTIFYFKNYFVVAMVDGEPISRLSVIERLEKRSGKTVLDSIITEKLIDNETKRQGISVSEDDIDAEIKTIEASVTAQGATLEDALDQQGMTMEDFRKSITLQKKLEKLLGDKIKVSDEEITKSLGDQAGIPAGKEEEIRQQVTQQLESEKLNQEAGKYIEELRTNAKIQLFMNY